MYYINVWIEPLYKQMFWNDDIKQNHELQFDYIIPCVTFIKDTKIFIVDVKLLCILKTFSKK